MITNILHTGDIHLRSKHLDEILRCGRFIVDKAREEVPDLIIIAGDIFDNQVALDSEVVREGIGLLGQLGDIAPMIIVQGTRTHDRDSLRALERLKTTHETRISFEPETILFDGEGFNEKASISSTKPRVLINTLPAPPRLAGEGSLEEQSHNIARHLETIITGFGASAAEFDCPHVIAGHVSVMGAKISDKQLMLGMDVELPRGAFAPAKADLICLAHIHFAQFIPDNIYYCGSTSRLNYGEDEGKGFWMHKLTWGEKRDPVSQLLHVERKSRFIETPARKMILIEKDLTAGGEIIDQFKGMLTAVDFADLFIRIRYRIKEKDVHRLGRKEVEEIMSTKDAYEVKIEVEVVPELRVRCENLVTAGTLRQKIEAMPREEPLPESVLEKADRLEDQNKEEIEAEVMNLSTTVS